MNEPVRLPDKLSALLRVAVEDAQKCEATDRYILRMGFWHKPLRQDEGKCSVCMAGAVMAQRLGADPAEESELIPADFDQEEHLESIDDMRLGSFDVAAQRLGLNASDALVRAEQLVEKHFSNETGRAPWGVYLEAADILEQAGL